MAARPKNPAAAALDTLNNESPAASPGLTDNEELSPEEQALIDSGTAEPPETPVQPAPTEPAPAGTQPAEEPPSEPIEESDEEVEKKGQVPAAVLVAQRRATREAEAKAKAQETRATELQAKWDKMNERLLQLQERQAQQAKPVEPQKPPEDVEPDRQANYTDWLEWKIRQQDKAIATIQTGQQNLGQVTEAARGVQQIDSMERQFIANGHPDYYDRVNFVREHRDKELQLMGYRDDRVWRVQRPDGSVVQIPGKQYRQQIIMNEAAMIVQAATDEGKNPAETIHTLSEQWGYTPAGSAQAAPAAAPTAVTKPTAQQQITAQQRRQAASTSVTALRSVPPEGPVSLEDIAAMDDEAYEKYLDKNGGDLQALLRSE